MSELAPNTSNSAFEYFLNSIDGYATIFEVDGSELELVLCNDKSSTLFEDIGLSDGPFDPAHPINSLDLGPLGAYARQAAREKRAIVGEILTPVGDEVYEWRGTFYPLFSDDGNVTSVVTVGNQIDPSDIKLAATEPGVADFTKVADSLAGSGFFEIDFQSQQVWINRPWLLKIGYQDLAVPISLDAFLYFVAPVDKDAFSHELKNHIDGKTDEFHGEFRILKRDGVPLWFSCQGQVVQRDEGGAALRFIGSQVDITSQKAAEDELERQRNLFRTIFDRATDTLIMTDSDKRIVVCNRATEEMFGLSSDEVMSQSSIQEFLPNFDVSCCDAGDTCFFEGIRSSGEKFPVAVSYAPLSIEGGVGQGILFTIRDQTSDMAARKELLEAKENAEYADRAKTEFLAMMSHEIRTPMNGIIGVLDLLTETTLSDRQEEFTQIIRSSSDTLLSIINQILDYSKLEAGQMELEEIEFDVSEVLSEVTHLLKERAIRKDIRMEVKSGVLPLPSLVGDPTRLRQVLYNLIGNAIKFTDEGVVLVEADVSGANDAGDHLVSFSVKDTGVGIDEKALENLFNPFFQADTSITRRFGGTGLGLSIVSKIVNLMQGELSVESKAGQGSTFSFTIPLREASVTDKRRERLVEQPLKEVRVTQDTDNASPLRILIAEDNQVNRLVIVGILERFAHDLTIVEDGKQAVQAVREKAGEMAEGQMPFDLILMDVQMPVIDGESATRLIRAMDGPSAQIPIVALTAHAMAGDRERYLQCGMDEYVSKPINPEALFDTIAKCAGRSSDDLKQMDANPTAANG